MATGVGVTPAAVSQSTAAEPVELRAGGGVSLLASWWWALSNFLASTPFQSGCVSAAVHAVGLVVVGSVMLVGDVAYQPSPIEVQLTIDEVRPPEPDVVLVELAAESAAAGQAQTNLAFGIAGTGGVSTHIEAPTVVVDIRGEGGGRGLGGDHGIALSGNGLLKEVEEVKKKAAFFGVTAMGRKFAFVVDTSGSMAQEDRWLRARGELERSLKELGYGQEFFIAFFNHTPFPMPQGKLIPAKSGNIAGTIKWIQRAVPAGGTEPWPALQMAINLKPDAVFLLTDGLFDPAVIENVKQLRGSQRIPIHTIGFAINTVPIEIQKQIEDQLSTIATSTGGSYRFVP